MEKLRTNKMKKIKPELSLIDSELKSELSVLLRVRKVVNTGMGFSEPAPLYVVQKDRKSKSLYFTNHSEIQSRVEISDDLFNFFPTNIDQLDFKKIEILMKSKKRFHLSADQKKLIADRIEFGAKDFLGSGHECEPFADLVDVRGEQWAFRYTDLQDGDGTLNDCIHRMVKASAREDSRYVFKGVYFDPENERIVATDGRRLHVEKFPCITPAKDVKPSSGILPAGYINAIRQAGFKITSITFYKEYADVKTDEGIHFTIKLIDGQYPAYNQTYPVGEPSFKVKIFENAIDKKEVLEQMETLKQLYKVDGKGVAKVTLNINSLKLEQFRDFTSGPVFNIEFIIDALSILDKAEISGGWDDLNTMIMIKDFTGKIDTIVMGMKA